MEETVKWLPSFEDSLHSIEEMRMWVKEGPVGGSTREGGPGKSGRWQHKGGGVKEGLVGGSIREDVQLAAQAKGSRMDQ